MTNTKNSDFIHLRSHSEYSIKNSIVRIDALVAFAKEQQMPAIALTDYGNLFGAIKFYQKCCEAGVKPILGCDLQLSVDNLETSDTQTQDLVTILVTSLAGFYNLNQLINTQQQDGCVTYQHLEKTPTRIVIACR